MGSFGLPFPLAVAPASAIAMADAPPVPFPHYPQHPLWWIMLPVCIFGVILCDGLLYGIGRLGGPRLLEADWVKRFVVKPETRDRIETNFHKFGVPHSAWRAAITRLPSAGLCCRRCRATCRLRVFYWPTAFTPFPACRCFFFSPTGSPIKSSRQSPTSFTASIRFGLTSSLA